MTSTPEPNDDRDPISVRVLGPLRVERGSLDLDLGPPRSRMVLALLVSEVGRVVTTDRNSLIGRTSVPRSAPMVVSFTDDGSAMIGTEVLGTVVTAWSADVAMEEFWSLELHRTAASSRIHDGLLWVPADGALPIEPYDGATGMIAVPADRRGMADFARQKATRELTEGECQTYFASTCDEFGARLDA